MLNNALDASAAAAFIQQEHVGARAREGAHLWADDSLDVL